MKDRIHTLMQRQHMQQNAFAELLGISAPTLSNILTGRSNVTTRTIDAIKSKFPTLRTDWLLYGSGPMFEDDNPTSTTAADTSTPTPQETNRALTSEQDLFSAGGRQISGVGVQTTLNNTPREIIKYVDKPAHKITEIRIYFDDQTYETFVPKK